MHNPIQFERLNSWFRRPREASKTGRTVSWRTKISAISTYKYSPHGQNHTTSAPPYTTKKFVSNTEVQPEPTAGKRRISSSSTTSGTTISSEGSSNQAGIRQNQAEGSETELHKAENITTKLPSAVPVMGLLRTPDEKVNAHTSPYSQAGNDDAWNNMMVLSLGLCLQLSFQNYTNSFNRWRWNKRHLFSIYIERTHERNRTPGAPGWSHEEKRPFG